MHTVHARVGHCHEKLCGKGKDKLKFYNRCLLERCGLGFSSVILLILEKKYKEMKGVVEGSLSVGQLPPSLDFICIFNFLASSTLKRNVKLQRNSALFFN